MDAEPERLCGPELWSGASNSFLPTPRPRWGSAAFLEIPIEVGADGGSAFVLFYLLGIALVVLPLMLAELALGRRGRSERMPSGAS